MIRILPALLALAAARRAGRGRRPPLFGHRFRPGDRRRALYRAAGRRPRRPRRRASGSREALDRVTRRRPGPDPAHPPQPLRLGRHAGRRRRPGHDRARHPQSALGPADRPGRRSTSSGARGLNVEFTVEGSGRLRATSVAADNLALGLLGSGRSRSPAAPTRCAAISRAPAMSRRARLRRPATPPSPPTRPARVALTVDGPATITANGLGKVTHPRARRSARSAASAPTRSAAPAQISARTASFPARSGGSCRQSSSPSPRSGGASAPRRDSASPDAPRLAQGADRHQLGIEPDDRLAVGRAHRRSRGSSGARRSGA